MSVGLWATRSWVRILPLPVIPEVTLGSHSSSSLTASRCKIGTGLGLEIQSWLWGSLCTSKSRAWVMMDPIWLWNPQVESTEVWNRAQVAPPNGDLSPQKFNLKKKNEWPQVKNHQPLRSTWWMVPSQALVNLECATDKRPPACEDMVINYLALEIKCPFFLYKFKK